MAVNGKKLPCVQDSENYARLPCMQTQRILLAEIGNHLSSFFSKSECKLHENLLTIPKIISEGDQKSLQYIASMLGVQFINYIPNLNFLRIKIVNTPSSVSSILLCCKTDSDSTETLINSQDHGELWRVNDNVQNILQNVKNFFVCPLQTFKQ